MEPATYRAVSIQICLAVVFAGMSYLTDEAEIAKAAGFGMTVALMNSLLLVWRMRRAVERKQTNLRRDLGEMYRSGIERFLVVAVLLGWGIGWMKLMALPMVAAFAAGQLVLIISSIASGIEKQ